MTKKTAKRYLTFLQENKIYLLIVAIGALLPFIFTGILINKFAVNVPFGDDWAMVPIFQKIDAGHLGLSDIWAQHNEHRIFFPRLIIIAVAYFSSWHLGALMIASLLISVISILTLLVLIWTTVKSKFLAALTCVIVSGWFYSTVQWENWLWGWQVEWFLCIAAFLTAVLLIAKSEKSSKQVYYIGGAAVASLVATLSLGSGVLAWPIILAWLLYKKRDRSLVMFWGSLTLLVPIIYYLGYHKPVGHPSIFYFLHHPIETAQYLLIYLGRPMSSQEEAAATWGALFLALLIPIVYLAWANRKSIDRFLPWIAIALFSLGSALLTTLSRVGFGLEQAVSSRYTTISLLYIIAVTAVLAILIDLTNNARARSGAIITLASLSIPLLISCNIQGIQGFRDRSEDMHIIKACTHEVRPTKECLIVTIPGIGVDKSDLDYIKAKGWGGY